MLRAISTTQISCRAGILNIRCIYSTPQLLQDSVQVNEERIESSNLKQASSSQHQRQIKNKPFIKSLFCGTYVYDYLKFPEYDTNSKLDQLNSENIEPLKKYMKAISHEQIIDKNGSFDAQALKDFKKLGLFAKSMPKEFGGQELDATGVARVLEETGKFPSLGMSLIYNNEVAAKAILLYGSSNQKTKLLNRISSGDLKASYCYGEFGNSVDPFNFNTIAKFNSEDNTYTLNGKKSWISLISDEADSVFVVLAKSFSDNNEADSVLNAFVIDKAIKGVKISKQLANFNGLNLYEVEFENVKLTKDDLLGVEGSGHDISMKLSENSRYLVGAVCVGLLKDLLKTTVEFAIDSRRFDKSISEFEFVKDRLADVEAKLYTMESMTYMTAGIIDSYEIPDIGCETALTKIYCTETLRTCVNSCLDILAMGAYSKLNETQASYISDLNYLTTMFSTNDFLRLYVATNGTIAAGLEFGDSLAKLRNPLTNPGYALKKMFANWKLARSVNKKAPEYLYLWEHVHPSLNEPVYILEQCTVKLMMTIKYSLLTYGRETTEVQYSMKHLANIAMHLYALNSTIARASRAYSIGLFNAQHEIGLVYLQASESEAAINKAFNEIVKCRVGQGQENIKNTVADNMYKARMHAASHSTSRNY